MEREVKMKYRLATNEDAENICEIVRSTIKTVYPRYYREEIVEAFLSFHNIEGIREDIKNGNVYVLLEDNKIIGTGTKKENHITRVYILPEFQGKGYGTFIMNELEREIAKNYNSVNIDASLPACRLYYKIGYKTVGHGIWECQNEVLQVYEIMEKELNSTLRLRHYKRDDAKIITSWIKDEIGMRRFSSDRYETFPITAKDMNDKYCGNNGDCSETDNFYPFTAFDDSGVVGHLIMRFTDEAKKIIRFGFVIVDDTKRGKGYGKQMINLAIKYAFEIFKADKLTLGVFANNDSAYHCYKAAGFREVPSQEMYYDILGERWKCIEMELNRNGE